MSVIEDHLLNAGFSRESIDETLNAKSSDLYKVFSIRQKGKVRVIEEPLPLLKEIQQALIKLFERIQLQSSCTARKGSNILQNAQKHFNAQNILKIDIKSCYPSITINLLSDALLQEDPELLEEIDLIGSFCFIEKEGQLVLPTGAPTSPILCNIALTILDKEIQGIATQYGYTYSRYIDDMIFSNTQTERHWELKKLIEAVVRKHSLVPNFKKSRWSKPTDKMVVTGVRLNGKSRVPKDFSRLLRAKLQNIAKDKKELDPETIGCLAYVKSIDPQKYEDFLKYFERRKAYVPPG
jgi:retron-type reverse transcriptase